MSHRNATRRAGARLRLRILVCFALASAALLLVAQSLPSPAPPTAPEAASGDVVAGAEPRASTPPGGRR